MSAPHWAKSSMNAERPVGNQTAHQLELSNRHRMHLQRLHDISIMGKRRVGGTIDKSYLSIGNEWRQGPQRSRPSYTHLRDNLKKQQVESERFDAIEHENRLLLEKMSALMSSGSVVDPTQGTWEFQPGVRLNRFQMPVIDHAVSHEPQMPQRGAAREPESLNWGARRRELARITAENRGIVHRIQGRGSYYPADQWVERSEEHDKHLLLIRRPVTSHQHNLPTHSPSPPTPTGRPPRRRPRSFEGTSRRNPRGMGGASVTEVLSTAKEGDAHLLLGLTSGLNAGACLILRPDADEEEQVEVHETWLRQDGLVVLLKEPLKHSHPAGVRAVLIASS